MSSGLIYLRNRYYDPATSRMLSEDTNWGPHNMIYGDNPNKDNPVPDINAIMQSANLYVYALNNPLRWIDPTGKAVTGWDRQVMGGIPGRIERMQWITDNWNSVTAEQQKAWREEVKGYRDAARNKDGSEYTDDSGITRSTATGGEIKFLNDDNVMGSSGTTRIIMWIGYSINNNNEVVLANYRQGARFVNASMGVYYSVTEQSFTTDGTNVYYDIKYNQTTTYTVPSFIPIFGGGEWDDVIDGGHTYGTKGRSQFR